LGVIGHLLSADRKGARVHNARCAFIAGLAFATRKDLLLVQEGSDTQPIDYRDIVVSYNKTVEIPKLAASFIKAIWDRIQGSYPSKKQTPFNILERLDLGDLSAENERHGLQSYFVKTGQFAEAKRGYARLVVGPKGRVKRQSYSVSLNHLEIAMAD